MSAVFAPMQFGKDCLHNSTLKFVFLLLVSMRTVCC